MAKKVSNPWVVGNILTEGGKNSPEILALYYIPVLDPKTDEAHDQAIDLAVQMVNEQLTDEDGKPLADREEIVEELEDDGSFADPNGQWTVFIREADPHKPKKGRKRK